MSPPPAEAPANIAARPRSLAAHGARREQQHDRARGAAAAAAADDDDGARPRGGPRPDADGRGREPERLWKIASLQQTASPTHTAPLAPPPSQRLFEALRLAADAADALGGGDADAADAASAAFLAAAADAQAAMLALAGRHGTPAPRAADAYAARLGGAADAAAARGAAAGGADACA